MSSTTKTRRRPKNMAEKNLTCSRCKGTGYVDSPVLYAGRPGGCFKCATRGTVPNRAKQYRLDLEEARSNLVEAQKDVPEARRLIEEAVVAKRARYEAKGTEFTAKREASYRGRLQSDVDRALKALSYREAELAAFVDEGI